MPEYILGAGGEGVINENADIFQRFWLDLASAFVAGRSWILDEIRRLLYYTGIVVHHLS